jgi:hypothetical protein
MADVRHHEHRSWRHLLPRPRGDRRRHHTELRLQQRLSAILVVCSIVFVTNLPIAYYSSRYNIDMDLLTRGAGFGYIGSTIPR